MLEFLAVKKIGLHNARNGWYVAKCPKLNGLFEMDKPFTFGLVSSIFSPRGFYEPNTFTDLNQGKIDLKSFFFEARLSSIPIEYNCVSLSNDLDTISFMHKEYKTEQKKESLFLMNKI